MTMTSQVIENPKSDSDLPLRVRERIAELVAAGYVREVLLITEQGEVVIDPDLVSYDQSMQAEQPGRPRSEYLTPEYPARLVIED